MSTTLRRREKDTGIPTAFAATEEDWKFKENTDYKDGKKPTQVAGTLLTL